MAGETLPGRGELIQDVTHCAAGLPAEPGPCCSKSDAHRGCALDRYPVLDGPTCRRRIDERFSDTGARVQVR
jgi:hypothetical protein